MGVGEYPDHPVREKKYMEWMIRYAKKKANNHPGIIETVEMSRERDLTRAQ